MCSWSRTSTWPPPKQSLQQTTRSSVRSCARPRRSRVWRACLSAATAWSSTPAQTRRTRCPISTCICWAAAGWGGRRDENTLRYDLRHMDLFEYQGKQYFARFGIPVSPGGVADTVDEAVAAADRVGYPVVVKAQVQVGGRGKGGGIQRANNAEEVRRHAGNILGMDIRGHAVHRLWIERASDIKREYYASFTLDRGARKHLGMVSAKGGVEIEQVAAEDPAAIARIHVDPVHGLSDADARKLVDEANLDEEARSGAVDILKKLYRCFVEGDADLVEINPLVLTPDGKVHALDAKVSLDNNAEFRHPEWAEYRATEVLDEREKLARSKGLQYIGLSGSVGIIANGAGLAMSTLDVVNQVGGSPANFLDIGGGADANVMASALEVINTDV